MTNIQKKTVVFTAAIVCIFSLNMLSSALQNGMIIKTRKNISNKNTLNIENYNQDKSYKNNVFSHNVPEDVKKSIEDFIPKNLSFMFSSTDFDLVAPNSEVFIEFLKLRNEYRTRTLNAAGVREDDLEFVKYNNFKYNSIKWIKDDVVEVDLKAEKMTKYKDDPESGESVFNYKVVLINDGNSWKIWSATVFDEATNPFDNKENIDIIKLCGYPNSQDKINDIDMKKNVVKNLYNKEIKEFFK